MQCFEPGDAEKMARTRKATALLQRPGLSSPSTVRDGLRADAEKSQRFGMLPRFKVLASALEGCLWGRNEDLRGRHQRTLSEHICQHLAIDMAVALQFSL